MATYSKVPVRVRIHRPRGQGTDRAVVLQIHGGGLVMGTAEAVEGENRSLSAELDCVVVAVDYRLAPEHPFPAALDDCCSALQWINENREHLGIDPTRTVVKGESAGGGIAAALCQRARDLGEYPIALQHLTYPMLDDRTCTRGDLPEWSGKLVWTPESNNFGWSAYLGHQPGIADTDPYAAPSRATDLTGVAPAYIVIGGLDLFLLESIDYSTRLALAGVPVELQVVPGAFHSFLTFGVGTELADRMRSAGIEAIRRVTSRPPDQSTALVH